MGSNGPTPKADPTPLALTHRESTCAAVSRLVERLIERHERLLEAMSEHRESIRTADPDRLARATETTGALLEEIARLEDERRTIVGGPGKERVTLAQIAATASEPDRGTLLSLGEKLRTLIERAREERRGLARAAVSLARHMDGLTRQVVASLSHSGTYSRRGVIDSGPPVVSGLDVSR